VEHVLHAAGMAAPAILTPLKPAVGDWYQCSLPPSMNSHPGTVEVWMHKAEFVVITAVEVVALEPGEQPKGPEYHLSMSKQFNGVKVRCDSNEAKWILDEFKCFGAEEDNHVPSGFVRNFWRPVNDNLVGIECACKDDEPAIREDKGDFVWRPTKGMR
jgi:hypothetical protein